MYLKIHLLQNRTPCLSIIHYHPNLNLSFLNISANQSDHSKHIPPHSCHASTSYTVEDCSCLVTCFPLPAQMLSRSSLSTLSVSRPKRPVVSSVYIRAVLSPLITFGDPVPRIMVKKVSCSLRHKFMMWQQMHFSRQWRWCGETIQWCSESYEKFVQV